MKITFIISLLLITAGCASFRSADTQDVIDQVGRNGKFDNSQDADHIKQLVYSCQGCIEGSASELSIKEDGITRYQLAGAFGRQLPNNVFDIPVEYNSKVKKWIKFYTKNRSGKRSFMIHAERAGKYAPIMSEIMAQKGLPRDLIFLAMAESGFRNDARSWASAVGPWQFMSFTGKKFGLKVNWNIDQRRDPFRATIAAGDYLTYLHKYFGDWKLAFSGYNAGEGKVGRAIKRYKTRDFWRLIRGRYLKPETKNYTPKIMALAIVGKNLEYFGFTGKNKIVFKDLIDFETIEVPANTDIIKVGSLLNIKQKTMKKLNPEILRWYTPLNSSYKLKVPVGKKIQWNRVAANANIKANRYQTYRIKSGANLKNIAKLYKVPVTVLEDINGYNRTKYLSANKIVKLPFRIGQNRRRDPMYADLYRVKKSRRRRTKARRYKKIIRTAMRKGKRITKPSQYYTVKKGDTLWTVARRSKVSMNTIIRSNQKILKNRMIRRGDRLVIR